MPVALSIAIVNWNTRAHLERCLESIEVCRNSSMALGESTAASSQEDIEVIVVDNGSSDGSAELVREYFSRVRLIANPENVGFSRANNQALWESEGQLVMLLNSDTEVRKGALATLMAFMAEHPRAGAVGPRLLNADGTLQPSCHPMLTPEREFWRLAFLDRALHRATYPMENWRMDRPHRVEVIKGACLMLRRKALDEVGPLDEGYFMYTEEVDLCYRLAQAGWELWWEPRAKVVHYGEASTRQVAEKMYLQLYRSKVQFYRKFGGESEARRFKRLVRMAYWPRAVLSPRTQVYRRLLAELGEM